MTTTHDASDVYQAIEQSVDDAVTGTLDVSYARAVDPAGDPGKHLFIVAGHADDAALLQALADLEAAFAPDGVDLTGYTKGFHLRFEFAGERIVDAPPESRKDYGSVSPHDARNRTVEECHNCRAPSPTSVPPLLVKHRPENPHADAAEEEIHLCVRCTPGNFDDVARGVEAFGVEDGEVTRLQFEEDVSDEDDYSPEWELRWHDVDEVDNPYIDDVIRLMEREFL